MSRSYRQFLEDKAQIGSRGGFKPSYLPDFLYDFQHELVSWAIDRGRSGIFADCGLGKTPMQLVWAENVRRKTNRPVLILTPLAVSAQTIRESEKFGIEARRSSDGRTNGCVTVANYERLHHFNPDDFGGVVCDESSILKSFNGARRKEITVFMRKIEYRLLCTATAAPNDYAELGTSSEALGFLGHMDMLNKFFKNDANNSAVGRRYGEVVKWLLKGHAEEPFWRWVCSWARAVRRPSDLGFDDGAFTLPPLKSRDHIVEAETLADGMLFAMPAHGLDEQREERRRTITERCEKVADLVSNTGKPALVWCHLNDEADAIERLVSDAVQVAGKHSDEQKEERLLGFASGDIRVLVTKPKIGAWGLNYQHCSHVVFFPSHSYEQYYQGVRRCWRFGQPNPVTVDIVLTEGEASVMANLKRKAVAADEMFARLVAMMNKHMHVAKDHSFTNQEEIPSWL